MEEDKPKKEIVKKRPMQRKIKSTDIKKKRILEELINFKGIVNPACNAAGIDRSTFYRWQREDPLFADAVEEVNEICIDFVESKLLELIDNGNASATFFYLRNKGKQRGYSESIDVNQTGQNMLTDININIIPPKKLD